MKVADIFEFKNGKKRVDFFHLGIYDLIKNQLNFRFINVDGKGYYMEKKNDVFTKSSFHKMESAFRNHIYEKFDDLEINGEINYVTFLNFYYKKSPITNGHFAKTYLNEDFELSDNELHILKLETDFLYRNEINRKEMADFISNENFIETRKLFGTFSKGSKVFYKQTINDSFLIFIYFNWNKKKIAPTYDLFKIDAINENDLFKKSDDDIITIKLSFNLNKDLELYKEEKTCGNTVYN